MEYLLNNLSDQQLKMPTRLYNFMGLDLIIKFSLLKEKSNSNTRIYIFASTCKNILARGNNYNFLALCTEWPLKKNLIYSG